MLRVATAVIAVALAASSSAAADGELGPEVPVSRDLPGMVAIHPEIARSGDHFMAVWIDPVSSELWASVDGSLLPIASSGTPMAAAIGNDHDSFIVTWYDALRNTRYARRITFAGRMGQTILLGTNESRVFCDAAEPEPAAVACDESSCVIVWADDVIRTVHVDPDDEVSQRQRSPEFAFATPHSPQVLRIAAGKWFLMLSVFHDCACGVINPGICQPSWSIDGESFDVLSASNRYVTVLDRVNLYAFDTATTDQNIVIAWTAFAIPYENGIFAATTTFDGVPVVPPRLIDPFCLSGGLSRPRVRSNGSDIVIAWTRAIDCGAFASSYAVFARRLDADLRPVGESFVVARDVAFDPPAIALTVNGDFTIAYSKLDLVTGKTAIFARTLGRSVPLSTVHRRSASP